MNTREQLLTAIGSFLALHGMTERRFGMLVANDHKFMDRLRHQSVTLERIERAERFMAEYGKPGSPANDATAGKRAC